LPRPTTFVKIPKDRIGALIGQGGIIKERIEKQLGVEIGVDSETGDVNLNLSPNAEDPSLMFRAKELVTAIGKGFAPERAFRLIQDDEALLEVIDLREIFGRSSSELRRVKGRIIGQKGKTRRIIEELTDAEVSIYGHTVTIIANADEMDITREAVKMLLQGRQHSSVYRFLNKKRRELEKKKLELWEKTPEELEK
jgi:ribosomal RNA assembly protein